MTIVSVIGMRKLIDPNDFGKSLPSEKIAVFVVLNFITLYRRCAFACFNPNTVEWALVSKHAPCKIMEPFEKGCVSKLKKLSKKG